MYSACTNSLFEALGFLARVLREHGVRKSDMWEVQDVFLEYNFNAEDFGRFEKFCSHISDIEPFMAGYKKSVRAYSSLRSSITKPSYYGRIRDFKFKKVGANDPGGIDQLALIADKFTTMPQASNLQMSIFHPQDLIDQFRPGYVPCLSFIDVKFRRGHFRFKPFFRSCDLVEVAPFDMQNMVRLIFLLVDEIQQRMPEFSPGDVTVMFMFSRIFAYKRRMKNIDLYWSDWVDMDALVAG